MFVPTCMLSVSISGCTAGARASEEGGEGEKDAGRAPDKEGAGAG